MAFSLDDSGQEIIASLAMKIVRSAKLLSKIVFLYLFNHRG